MRLPVRFRRLRRDARGVAAMEFGLVAPGLVLMIVGIAQLGILFMANAGLRNCVAEGARYATIWPRPSDTAIRNYITSHSFGHYATSLSTPTVTHGVDSGANYVDITVTYSVPLNFVFFTTPAVSLSATRRAYIQPT